MIKWDIQGQPERAKAASKFGPRDYQPTQLRLKLNVPSKRPLSVHFQRNDQKARATATTNRIDQRILTKAPEHTWLVIWSEGGGFLTQTNDSGTGMLYIWKTKLKKEKRWSSVKTWYVLMSATIRAEKSGVDSCWKNAARLNESACSCRHSCIFILKKTNVSIFLNHHSSKATRIYDNLRFPDCDFGGRLNSLSMISM